MTKKPRRIAIVVDTSVARTSGDPAAPGSSAAACRDALKAMMDADLDLAWSDAIAEEWAGCHAGASQPLRRYASRFARKWLLRMRARRRVRRVEPARCSSVRNAAEAELTAKQCAAIEKDMHLVEAALASDQRVLSLDNTMRALLARLAVHELRNLLWANPVEPGGTSWLRDGARSEETFLLTSHH